jgi:ketosteroid isomerase-like protein
MVTTLVTPAALKQAIEHREAGTLIGFYADDATMRIIDRDHPPSKPLEIKGRAEIARYYEDVCGRAMTHRIESAVADGGHLAFVQACAYPDGTRVCCSAMLDLEGGKIVRQTAVQAWDG